MPTTGIAERVVKWAAGYPDVVVRKVIQRAPVLLWRLGLGALVGRGDEVLLTTVGRKSGRLRHTPLSARRVDSDLYLWSPYGDRAQWYLNARAHPIVTIQTADGPRSVLASHVTDPDEIRQLYRVLEEEPAPSMLDYYLDRAGLAHSVEEVVNAGRGIHALRLDPADVSGPPPLKADLVWLWAIPASLIVLRLARRCRRPIKLAKVPATRTFGPTEITSVARMVDSTTTRLGT
ncbi:MAG TPA: nitroreductase/quinone reductase family protein [Jiangellaceae bacterium]